MDRLTASAFEQTDGAEDWRILDGDACAWFDAPSLAEGAALVRRVAELVGEAGLPDIDLRLSGMRIRVGTPDADGLTEAGLTLARAISAAAHDLGLTANPAALQAVHLTIDTTDLRAVKAFWQTALAYQPTEDDALHDPSRRDPAIAFHRLDQPRPLRNRIHVDVVRPSAAVETAKATIAREASGPYGLALADADGNEIDLVPGDHLPPGPDTADWQVIFSAMTYYPVTAPIRAAELATTVAALADDAGVPLMIDLRADGVTIDSGKDQWEDDAKPSGARFAALAGRIQSAAHELGRTADPTPLRFVQLGIDAVDIPAVRSFWTTVLGYEHDPREFLTDIVDPRRLNPVLFLQDMDASEEDRRRQRNRTQLDLVVPTDQAQARIDAAVAAGGQILSDTTPGRCTIADPEGNEVTVVAES